MEHASDLMAPEPRCVHPDAPLGMCAELMLEHGVRHVPVVDEGGVVGLLTDASVFGRGRFGGGKWSFGAQTAAEAALPVGCLPDSTPAARAVRKLIGRECVVVLGAGGGVVGTIAEHDAVRLAPHVIPAFETVGGIASRPVDTVMAHAPALEAWDALRDSGRRHLVVTDPRGAATDVLSLRDLVRAGIRPGDDRLVSQICSQTALHTVGAGISVQEAARRMGELGIGCLPTLDPSGVPLTILTRSDVLRVLAQTLEDPTLFGPPEPGGRLELFPLIRSLRGPAPEAALAELAARLPAHFAQETRPGGLFDHLCACGCPDPLVEGLRYQHGALAESLAALVAMDRTDPLWDAARIRFANALEAHEFEESRAHLAAR